MLAHKYEVFLEVARHLSFSKASQALFISQPAVSKQIKALEEHYKTILLERKGNSINLTPVGKVLYERLLIAQRYQKELDFEMSKLSAAYNPHTSLRFGASTTVALYILPPVLSAYCKKHPEHEITLMNRNTENILNALMNHDIDLGITEAINKVNTLTYHPFIKDEIIPVCSRKSKIHKQSIISAKDLLQIPIALRERGSGSLLALQQSLESKGIKISDLPIVIRLGGTEALKNFIIADDCIGFLPRLAIEKELKLKELVEIKIKDLKISRQFYFIQRKGDEASQIHDHFIRFAKKYYNQ